MGGPARYYPYGQERQATPEGTEKFATYYRDETGLDYAWSRHYSPAWGRFLQADPYLAPEALKNPQGWNRYAYVAGDPVNYKDPTGLSQAVKEFTGCVVQPVGGPFGWACGLLEPTRDAEGGDPRLGQPGPEPRGGGSPASDVVGIRVRTLTATMITQLQVKIDSLKDTNCERVFAREGITLSSLKQAASGLTFYDAADPLVAALPLRAVTGRSVAGTVGSLAAQHPHLAAMTVTVPRQRGGGQIITPNVVLTQLFWQTTAQQQDGLLLHELLHYRLQLNDEQIVRLFGIDMGPLLSDKASRAISEWLYYDCRNVPVFPFSP